MIESFTGLPGSGKTLHAVRRLLQAKASGRPAYANFHSRSNDWEYVLFDDIRYIDNGLVVLDEAHMMFSSRNWSATTQAQLGLFQQHRKLGIDLIWIAQSANRVDVALRELTAFEHRHRRMGKLVLVRVVDPMQAGTEKEKTIRRNVFAITPLLTNSYWTEERIGNLTGQGAGFGRLGLGPSGPPANWVRWSLGDHVGYCPVEELDLSIVYDSLEPLYRDVYGRFTALAGDSFARLEAAGLYEHFLSVKDAFFESAPEKGSKKASPGR